MALGENNNMGTTMLVSPSAAPMYYGNGGCGLGLGGDWGSLIILFLLFGMFGNGGFGYGGGFGGNSEFPWLFNGQNGINANMNNGFQNAQLNDNVTSVRDGISALSTQLCNSTGNIQNSLCSGFSGVNASINGAQNAIAQQMYTNQIADMERSYAAQTANTQGLNALQSQLAQCCCDNRAATQDVKFTIAQEECATRASNTANMQTILDKLCQLELDGYKRENDSLRSQLTFANIQASDAARTADIKSSQVAVANQMMNDIRSCPIPAQPVYGNTPIFTCAQNVAGCGCNGYNG